MIYSIMDDITVIEKLKLADMAALDGAISNIRIFKLGSLEHKIAPTKAATSKLAQILGNNVGGGGTKKTPPKYARYIDEPLGSRSDFIKDRKRSNKV